MTRFVLAAILLLGASPASAQERGQFGLTMGYPAAIGIVWHPTERLGIKLETNFVAASSELESGPLRSDRDVENRSFGFGVAGLFYLGRADNVSTYFSPRLAYSRTTTELEGSGGIIVPVELRPILPVVPPDLRTESTSFSVAGSYGAQYSPNRRFSLFGEVGLSYASSEEESSSFLSPETEGSSVGVRAAVGVVLYFN